MTPETFAKWKRTRMDKKQAAEDIQKKAKEAQAAAGKSNGMSGRDLVRSSQKLIIISDSLNQLLFFLLSSSLITQNGLLTMMMKMTKMNGISINTDERLRRNMMHRNLLVLRSFALMTMLIERIVGEE